MMATTLDRILRVHYGRGLKANERSDVGPWAVYGSNGEVGRHSEPLVSTPTLVIGRKGSVGAVTYAPNGGWIIDTAFYTELLEPGSVCLRYLYYALTQTHLEKHTITTSIPGISRDDIYRTKIPLPLLDEQKRIASILDKAEVIRRKRAEALRLTDQFIQSVFLDMFGDPVTNSRGWEVRRIDYFGNVTTGNTPSREVQDYYGEAIEWIKSDNINTPFHFLTRAAEGLSEKGKKVARVVGAGATLITCIAGSRSCIGNVALADREVAFNQQINAVTPAKDVNPYFFYCLVMMSRRLIQGSSTNSMKGMVSKSELSCIQLPYPPEHLQNKFGDVFLRLCKSEKKQNDSAAGIEELNSSIVQRAFAGEL